MTKPEQTNEPRTSDEVPSPGELDEDSLESVSGGKHYRFPIPTDPIIPIEPIQPQPIDPIIEPLPVLPVE